MRAQSRGLSFAPYIWAGIAGMVLVAALYVAHVWLMRSGGSGLGLPWLLALVLPGVMAAHLSYRAGLQETSTRQGALAGIVTAHFAVVLEVSVLVLAVFTTDWARYAQQVGSDIAAGVQDAALPATIVATLVVIAITYAGCVLLCSAGAALYVWLRNVLS